jgi:hypothetical protein
VCRRQPRVAALDAGVSLTDLGELERLMQRYTDDLAA